MILVCDCTQSSGQGYLRIFEGIQATIVLVRGKKEGGVGWWKVLKVVEAGRGRRAQDFIPFVGV